MRILINLATLKSGGGQNVALNFLYSILKDEMSGDELYFLVARGSAIHDFMLEHNLRVLSVLPRNPLLRMLKEVFYVNLVILRARIDVIYSYFGAGLFLKKIPQISGSADSNLYFPEIDFWHHYKGVSRVKKKLTDYYRVWGLKRSHAVVYENRILEVRARRLFGIRNTAFIKPSVNFQMELSNYKIPFEVSHKTKIGLFLCGWQLNKNYMLIPEIAKELRDRGADFRFVITAPKDDSRYCMEFIRKISEYEVGDLVGIVGPVSKSELASLYGQVDFVFLLSLLESFSNNIIEAWYFNKPLIVSDEEWARSICNDAAIYVARDNPRHIADSVLQAIRDGQLLTSVVAAGNKELATYPSIEERTMEELRYVKHIAQTC